MSNDPFIRRLSQFTPDKSGLDRDALLFAAGRASARPSRGWIALATALAASQVLTLGVSLWPGQVEPVSSPGKDTPPIAATKPNLPRASEAPSIWTLREQIMAAEISFPPVEQIDLGPAQEPLRAFGPIPPDLLD